MANFKSSLAILFCFMSLPAFAQNGALLAQKKVLTPFAARKMIEVCFAQAAREHYPIALAVADSAGNLLAYEATDAAMTHTGLTAQLKAKTAAIFRRSTAELYERVNKDINRAPEWMGFFPVPGGFPIVVDGETVGAIGAGSAGLSGGRDEDCAKAAIAAVMGNGKTAPPRSPELLVETRQVLTPEGARKLVDACIAYAGRQGFTALGISVVDPDGALLSFQGTAGASATALKTAELKAVTAAHWQRQTVDLFERVNKQINRAPEFIGDFPQPGGFPIFVGRDMVGAIGAGGAIGNQDDECAQAAIKAVFADATTERKS